jgi:hypothetical protein
LAGQKMIASSGLTAAKSKIAGVIRPTYLLDEGEQERAEPNRLLLLDPVTGAVDQLDAAHPRRRLRPHKIDRARRRIGAPIALPADEERRDIDRLARKQA